MAEQIRKNLEEDVAHKESILKNLQKLKSRQVEVNEKIENRKKEKEKPVVTELKSFTLGANKKPASILDRLGPKETKDPVQKVESDRFLRVKESQTPEQKSRDKRFFSNYILNTLATHQKEVNQDMMLERARAMEKELEHKFSEEYLLERESKEISSSLEKAEQELENVTSRIEELKEQLKRQKQLDRDSILSNFCKTKAQPSVYFRPAKIDDWATEKFGIKPVQEVVRDNSLSPETGKKTSREEKHGESDEEDRNTKKRKVEDDDVVIVQKSEKNDHNDDEEVQIIEVRTAKDDDFRIRVGEEGRSISLKES